MAVLRRPRYRARMAGPTVGVLLRDWRVRRRRSQLDVALETGVSTRHLSCVETGRARPSPELVMAVAETLEVPLQERNELLLAAGFAPRYSHTGIGAEAMAPFRASMQRVLDAHDPYPGVVIDRRWDVVLANRAAQLLTAGLPAHLLGPPLNVFRVCLHPDGLAPRTVELGAWAAYLLRQLHRTVRRTGDAALADLEREVLDYPTVRALAARRGEEVELQLVVPFVLDAGGTRLSMFTTLTTFGGPRDVTLDDLAVELFYPADDTTEAVLRGAAGTA